MCVCETDNKDDLLLIKVSSSVRAKDSQLCLVYSTKHQLSEAQDDCMQ